MQDEDPQETHRRLVRWTRMLVANERDAGIVDLPGTPPPATEPTPAVPFPPLVSERGAARPTTRASVPPAVAMQSRPPQPRTTTGPVHASAVSQPPGPSVPDMPPDPSRGNALKVRVLVHPADVLAPFGGLPAEVAACRGCGLCAGRTRAVFGEGNPAARLVFCGESPGDEEDRSGRPFVGAAGELLTAMIERGMQLRREDVFILNAVKCRPPENRPPTLEEIGACRPYLLAQLGVIRPSVVVALGSHAAHALLGDVGGIAAIRGRVFEHAVPGSVAKVVPTFHPEYLIRNPEAKRDAWADLQLVMRLLAPAT